MLVAAVCGRSAVAQDDVADIPAQDLRIKADEKQRYFLIGPAAGAAQPEAGFGLLIVLPGGDGSAQFHPFVKRIYKNALDGSFVVAQLVAPKWKESQQIVWPTAKTPVAGMKFSTEDFVSAVIEDVGRQRKIDPSRVYTLSWSSGGPPAYAVALTNKTVTGSFVAMSVFKPGSLPPLTAARRHAFLVYHSPADKTCPFRMAETAVKLLEKNGATTKLVSYEGGHGWRGAMFTDIAAGIAWLDKNRRDDSANRAR
jgi:predicted esterase